MTDKTETKARTGSEDKGQKRDRTTLDACYGRIGIPAVAAALTPRQKDRPATKEPRFTPYDRD